MIHVLMTNTVPSVNPNVDVKTVELAILKMENVFVHQVGQVLFVRIVAPSARGVKIVVKHVNAIMVHRVII